MVAGLGLRLSTNAKTSSLHLLLYQPVMALSDGTFTDRHSAGLQHGLPSLLKSGLRLYRQIDRQTLPKCLPAAW